MTGSVLEIKIHSTWGDRHYVGLTGLELFSDTGSPVQISQVSDYFLINTTGQYWSLLESLLVTTGY